MAQRTRPKNIISKETARKALELRKAGLSYRAIAEALNMSRMGAWECIERALKEVTAEPAKQVLQLELERLDTMLTVAWKQMRAGDMKALDRCLKIGEQRARLLGLNAPTAINHDATGSLAELLSLGLAAIGDGSS